jgi:ABC-type uncharacterized transport system permease subunit
MGIGQMLTMPLFFASNAICPLELMPSWLKSIAVFNPLTYLVDAQSGAMIVGGVSTFAYTTSLGVMLMVFAVFAGRGLEALSGTGSLAPGLERREHPCRQRAAKHLSRSAAAAWSLVFWHGPCPE